MKQNQDKEEKVKCASGAGWWLIIYPETVILETGLEWSEKMSDEKIRRKEVPQKRNIGNAVQRGWTKGMFQKQQGTGGRERNTAREVLMASMIGSWPLIGILF